jgi:hypothetical protein
MTANQGPMHVLWIEVPATISAEDLARVVEDFPPGPEGRYYFVHMDLMAGRGEALGAAWVRQGYRAQIGEKLTRYIIGTEPEHFAVFWLSEGRAPGQTAHPVLHVVGDDRGLTPDCLQTEPTSTEVSIEEYLQWQRRSS